MGKPPSILKVQRNIQAKRYIPLRGQEQLEARRWWRDNLAFPTSGQVINLYTSDELLIATGYERIVIGDYGAYMEFKALQLCKQHIRPKWPGTPSRPVKYLWMLTPNGTKVYHQQQRVRYADYQPGMYYISPNDLTTYVDK